MIEKNIINEILNFQPEESYICTYNFDIEYYETVFLPKIKGMGCHKNVVIPDGKSFNNQLENNLQESRKFGKDYIIIPYFTNLIFHPKIYFFKKYNKGITHFLYMVGSGNMTYTGLNSNQEIFFIDEFKANGSCPLIINSLKEYLLNLINQIKSETTNLVTEWLNQGFPQKTSSNNKKDNFVLLYYPDHENIFTKIKDRIGSEKVEKIILSAPFFDDKLKAVNVILKELNPKELEIVIQQDTAYINKEVLRKLLSQNERIKLLSVRKQQDSKRYLHAKYIVITTNHYDHLLVGSANISSSALLGEEPRYNYEACIYTKYPKKTLVNSMLPDKEIISVDKIKDNLNKFYMSYNADDMSREKLVFSECISNKIFFFFNNEVNKKDLTINIINIDLVPRTFKVMKGERNNIYWILHPNFKAIYANYGKDYIPIQNIHEIKKNSTKLPSNIENWKNAYLNTITEEGQDHFMNMMIDYITKNALENIDSIKNKSKYHGVISKKKNIGLENEIILVNKQPEYFKSKYLNTDYNFDFVIGLSFLFEQKKEKNKYSTEYQDFDKNDKSETLEHEKKFHEKQEKEILSVDSIEKHSRIFKRRRDRYLNVLSSTQNNIDIISWICYFNIVSVFQIPFLHKGYTYVKSKYEKISKSCINDREWINFINSTINLLGKKLFSIDAENIVWPKISIKITHEEIISQAIAVVIYSCATVYGQIIRSASSVPEKLSKKISYHRINLFCAALSKILIDNSLTDFYELEEKINKISYEFPCKWLSTNKNIISLKNEIQKHINFNFENGIKEGLGKLGWDQKVGFMLINDKNVPLWN